MSMTDVAGNTCQALAMDDGHTAQWMEGRVAAAEAAAAAAAERATDAEERCNSLEAELAAVGPASHCSPSPLHRVPFNSRR